MSDDSIESRDGVCRRRMDYELPELMSNLKADLALFEYGGEHYDLLDTLQGIYAVLEKLGRDALQKETKG